jgi:hypothetical protein
MVKGYHNKDGGIIVYDRDAIFWDDIRVPITSTKLGGSKDPTFSKFRDDGSSSQGVFTYFFSNIQEQELYFSFQIPHSYRLKTDLDAHIHWSPIVTNTGTVQWGLEYTIIDINGNFSLTNIIRGNTVISVDSQYKHIYTDIGNITGSGITGVSAMLLGRVFRDIAAPDDFEASVGLLEIDFHYQSDTRGSIKESSKW